MSLSKSKTKTMAANYKTAPQPLVSPRSTVSGISKKPKLSTSASKKMIIRKNNNSMKKNLREALKR